MEHLVIIHGAIGAKDHMIPLGNVLNDHFHVHYLELSGHGTKSSIEDPFSMSVFAKELTDLIDLLDLDKLHVFGYSMGGFIALLSAAQGEQRIASIFTLGTKLEWNQAIAEKETKLLNAENIAEKLPAFAAILAGRHGETHWKKVLNRTADLLIQLGNDQPINKESMALVTCPVHLCLADHDEMVSEDESKEVESFLVNGSFSRLPNAKHPIERVDVQALSQKVVTFIESTISS